MSAYYVCGGLLISSVLLPFAIFELGKLSIRKDLRKNIEALKEMKKTSNKEISGMIDIHLEELDKLGIFNFGKKSK